MNAKQMLAVAVVAIMAVAGVGAAFAYTATTTNVENTLNTNYLTIEQGRTYFSALDDGKMPFDTLNGFFYKTTAEGDNPAYKQGQLCISSTDATEEKTVKTTAYSIRSAAPGTQTTTDKQNYAPAITVNKDASGHDLTNPYTAYIIGWTKYTVTNSVSGSVPDFTLRFQATGLNLAGDTVDGKYHYYIVIATADNSAVNDYRSLPATDAIQKAGKITNDTTLGDYVDFKIDGISTGKTMDVNIYLCAVPNLDIIEAGTTDYDGDVDAKRSFAQDVGTATGAIPNEYVLGGASATVAITAQAIVEDAAA